MNRICVLSCDSHPGYQFFIPLLEFYWNKWDWQIALFYTEDCDIEELKSYSRSDTTKFYPIPTIDNVRPGTLAQTVRHFASDVLPMDSFLMVQDIDLIPLQPWNPDLTARTIWGYPELTGGSFVPVHYTGMTGRSWYYLMGCTGDLKADMERELKANGRAYSHTWGDEDGKLGYWDADWDILTQKVLAQKEKFTFIERGMVQCGRFQVPRGRVDRCSIMVNPEDDSYSWGVTRNQDHLVDMHCESDNSSSPEKWKNIKSVLIQVFGEIPSWMDQHAKDHYSKYGK